MAKNKRKWTPEEERKFEQVKITDDLMFGTVFRNSEECRGRWSSCEMMRIQKQNCRNNLMCRKINSMNICRNIGNPINNISIIFAFICTKRYNLI